MHQGNRPTVRDSLRSVLVTFAVAWLWVSVMVFVFSGLLGAKSESFTGLLSVTPDWLMAMPGIGTWMVAHPGPSIFAALIFAPIFEEAIFRVLPLSYALVKEAALIGSGHEKRGKQFVAAVMIVVCGIIFGVIHGKLVNIFIQGAVGILSARLYLRNYQVSQTRAYLMCVGLHFLYNFAVISASFFG